MFKHFLYKYILNISVKSMGNKNFRAGQSSVLIFSLLFTSSRA